MKKIVFDKNNHYKIVKKIFTAKCWKYFFVSSFLSLIQVAAYVAIILLLGYINSAVHNNPDKWLFPQLQTGAQQIAAIVPMMLAICVISFIFGLIGNKYSIKFAKQSAINLRNILYSKIQTFSMVDIEKFSQSSLINRLTIDITNFSVAAEFSARVLIKSIFLYLGGLVGLFLLINQVNGGQQNVTEQEMSSYWIVLGVLLLSVALIFVIVFISMCAYRPFKTTQKNLDLVNGLTQENVLGQRTIKSFNLQNLQFQQFDVANEKLRKSTTKSGYITAGILPSIYFFLDAALVLATWLSNKNLVQVLEQIYLLISLMIVALILTIVGIVQINRAIPSFKRAMEVINYVPSVQFNDEDAKVSKKNNIELHNVSFTYPNTKNHSLKNINLEIDAGEVVGVIGPTGAGKSTLINLIARMYDPTQGTIKLADTNLKQLSKHQLKSMISYCPQQVVLFSGTIRSNLEFGKQDASIQEMDEVIQIANLFEFVKSQQDGYDYKITQRATNLSGGQKQRLAIARALIKQAPVLLLDDATSALDMITERAICQELMKNIYKQTIFISSQRINAIRHANRIIVLDEGKIIAIGTHQQLLKTCQYYYDVAVIQMGKTEVDNEINQK